MNIRLYNYYIFDIFYRFLFIILLYSILYYNIDFFSNLLILDFLNNYVLTNLDRFNHNIYISDTVYSTKDIHTHVPVGIFYTNQILGTIMLNTGIKHLGCILLLFPYILYHTIIYISSVTYRNFHIYILYIITILLYIIHFFIYHCIIFPTLFNIDWDYIFDSDISNYIPYGIECVFTVDSSALYSYYIIGFFFFLIFQIISLFSTLFIRIVLYICLLLLFDISVFVWIIYMESIIILFKMYTHY